ncbi:unnamed protein product [Microthlaspi erraticum]|uniref:Uncharacterized protein n=1 Tax=Microthlaspi erraticum TaxID=1685480 RepID=A0A6D2J294_9BRAS|nr:unnamed protein product [Microthlaspi erraticum]
MESEIATSSAYLVHVQLPIPLFPDLNSRSEILVSFKLSGLDSVELELDFVFTSSSDSKQLDLDKDTWWARGHFTGPEWTYLDLRT